MDQVAIMKKSWGLLPKILSGEKTIESRWYHNRSAPWGRVQAGDTVYFKNSGEPITVRSKVLKVLSFKDLTPEKVRQILRRYAVEDGLVPKVPQGHPLPFDDAQGKTARGGLREAEKYYQLFQDKKYCLLIFLKDVERVKPFNINKRGFGAMAAWLSVGDINKIKLSVR